MSARFFNTFGDLLIRCCVTDGKYIWFTSDYVNAVFKMELENMVIISVKFLPFGSAFQMNTVGMIALDGNKITMYLKNTVRGHRIVYFDIDSETFSIPCIEFPDTAWGDSYDQDEDYLYIPTENSCKIGKINKRNYSVEYIDLESECGHFSTIKKIGNDYALVGVKNNEFIIYESDGKTRKVSMNIDGYKVSIPGNFQACAIVCVSDEVFIIPQWANSILRVNIRTMDIKIHGQLYNDYDFLRMPLFTSVLVRDNGNIMAYMNGYGCWVEFDSSMNILKKKMMTNFKEKLEGAIGDNIRKIVPQNDYIVESNIVSLKLFINAIEA
ncbi:hypothetical protein [Butyrivibrio sp. NC3005]|uniref:hypothetical protein n=1 Tax=Butyrivibrio sp. NC3005 TaxID=1280685 RepID=UPI0004269AB0|nr:hypothetical protein [Butyrivibrio sp. NC3005]